MQTQQFSLKFYGAKHNIPMFLDYYLAKLWLSAKNTFVHKKYSHPKEFIWNIFQIYLFCVLNARFN